MDRLPIAIPDAGELSALRHDAVWFDRSARGRTLIEGAQGAAMLGGLVSNDVATLAPGHGQYAAAPTPKGKILADPRIFRTADDVVLCDVPSRAAAGWHAMLRKFLPPRLAKHRDVSSELTCVGVYGPAAAARAAAATGMDAEGLAALPPYGVCAVELDGARGWVVRSVDLGVPGFDLIAPPPLVAAMRQRPGADAVVGSATTWEAARVACGRPEWGVDMDDGTIPQEANFDALGAISYTKGCYTGQETIARVHFRGHVNRHLRRVDGDTLVPGATLFDGEREVGDVRSVAAALDGAGAARVAIAMVRREIADGGTLTWHEGEQHGTCTVRALPTGLG